MRLPTVVLPLLIACSDKGADDDGGAGAADDTAVTDGGAADTGGDGGSGAGDTGDTGDDSCADAPTVTWSTFGQGFLLEACQGCHASTLEGDDRYGAPEANVFDTVDDAWDQADRILARAAAEPPTMPPLGGTTADDRTRLRWWLECGTPGT